MKIVAMLVLGTLSACGPMEGENRVQALSRAIASNVSGAASPESVPDVTLTRAQIESVDLNLMRIDVLSRGVAAFVFEGVRNKSRVTWLSEDGLSITIDRGVLIATRGFGPDLMGVEVPDDLAALISGSKYLRTYDFMNGLDQIERISFDCEIAEIGPETLTIVERTYQTIQLEETCQNTTTQFTNVYWRDQNGTVWQARQWVSEQLGSIEYRRL